MNYTSIEQSKKLLTLGLDPNTADLWYSLDETDPDYSVLHIDESLDWDEITVYDRALPCWSLGALLEVMPKIKEFYYPSLYKGSFSVTACMYSTQDHDIFKIYSGEDFLEAAYNMVVWLLENNYIKKKEE